MESFLKLVRTLRADRLNFDTSFGPHIICIYFSLFLLFICIFVPLPQKVKQHPELVYSSKDFQHLFLELDMEIRPPTVGNVRLSEVCDLRLYLCLPGNPSVCLVFLSV